MTNIDIRTHTVDQLDSTIDVDKQLFDSYSRLGEDLEECSFEFAWEAEKEAVEFADKLAEIAGNSTK